MTSRARRLTVILIAGAMLVGLVTTVAWAKATQAEVYGQITDFTEPTWEKRWLDDDFIGHLRGYRSDEIITGGNLEGVIHVVIDQNVNILTGEGDMHGSIVYVGASGTVEGRFDGTTIGVGEPFLYFDGYWVLHGTGECEGQKMHIHNYGTFPQTCEGYILDPHGE